MTHIYSFRGFDIYEADNEDENGGCGYAAFPPDESPELLFSPDFQADSFTGIIDRINCS